MTVAVEARIGTQLAGYRLEALLGRGGMSVVFRAADRRLERNVALKLLAPELVEDELFRARFLRESQLAASLDHPNIVPVYEAGEAEGLLYIAMRYVEGTDMRALLRREGPLPPERALALATQVADALDAAHERGLVHRDVKPSNVLISRQAGKEHCYLADFGLSKTASDRSSLTSGGHIVGTIDYVAPEQIQGAEATGRADVYSLACVVFECLTGEVPFGRPSDIAVIYAHLEDEPPRASERRVALPVELDDVLMRGMAKSAAERFPTCAALIEAARGALVQPVPLVAPFRRRRLQVGGALGTALAAAVIAAFFLARGGGGIPLSQASLVRIDAAGTAGATAVAKLPGSATAVTVCAGSVWVTSTDGSVAEIDPRSTAVARIPIGGRPLDVADVGNLAAVVSAQPTSTVTLVDAQFGRVSDVVRLDGGRLGSAAAVASGARVWVANASARELERLDPPYTAAVRTATLAGRSTGIAVGGGSVWITGDRALWKVDPARGRIVATIPLPFTPRAVAAGGGSVWLVDASAGTVVRVDWATGRIASRIRVGRNPAGIAAGLGAVWVANEADGTISRIDAGRGVVDRTIAVGGHPLDVAVGLRAVWVAKRAR